ncbi:MAG: ABC transporter permease, partial [Actinomycetota bacterium]|nr:ABC transporter permease [Actinomycetota bacterium]
LHWGFGATGDRQHPLPTGDRAGRHLRVLRGAQRSDADVLWHRRHAEDLLRRHDVYTDIWVTGAEGTSPEELRDTVAAGLPADVEALTGDDVAQEQKDAIGQVLQFINIFLYVFVVVALVVGSFLIVNTFSILVAQRARELALLRALGASRRQVRRLVLLEAFVIALVGSTIGIGVGFGIAGGIKAIFGAIGLDLSESPLVFTATTLLWSYGVGIGVTMVAAYLPARRAAKVAPVEALRDGVAMPETTIRRRLIVGIALTALGAGTIAAGLIGEGGRAALLVGIGILAVLLGVALSSPVIGRPLLALLRVVYRRTFGTIGQLSADNALRNPRRTAATASALMIGLALVATMSVLGQSSKASIDKIIATNFAADLVVSNAIGQPFPRRSPTMSPLSTACSRWRRSAMHRARWKAARTSSPPPTPTRSPT